MFTLTVTSLARAVLCDDVRRPVTMSSKWHTFFWPHYKICNHFLAWKIGATIGVEPNGVWA